MRLSTEQLERLAERIFKVLKLSEYVGFDYTVDERVEDRVVDAIITTLEDDAKMEDRLSREAERLVSMQSHIAKSSGRSMDELVDEVKNRLARSKRVVLGDGPERADTLAEKVFRNVWKIEGIDFFSDDRKIQNCIGRSIFRFRHEDDRLIEALEKLTSKKCDSEAFSASWCQVFDKNLHELRSKLQESKRARDTAAAQGLATEAVAAGRVE
jgi:hypothetical protein